MADDRLVELQRRLREFAAQRDWEQYHTPKNLVMALAGEVGELVDLFQWLTPEESVEALSDPTRGPAVRSEIADVVIYLARLADVLGVDLFAAADEKLVTNSKRFPVRSASSTTRTPS